MSSNVVSPGSWFRMEKLSTFVGVVGSIITISLTLWNTHTKSLIDEREGRLKELEAGLKERSTGIEESKERVDRYKWVFSLFGELNDKDERKRNFTISLIRLALTTTEAEQLFTSLQTSSDKGLQEVGQTGIAAIQVGPIIQLTAQLNASTPELRKSAVAALERDYKSSPQAIAQVLKTFEPDQIASLSPSGIINGLYYLSDTDPSTWNAQQVAAAKQAIARIEAKGAGPQTKSSLDALRSLLQKVPAGQ
jgi:hypothetical protein